MLLLTALLSASQLAMAAPLERLDLGVAASTRFNAYTYASQPIEFSVTSFVLPWLAIEGRVGIAPSWSPYGFFAGDAHALLAGGVRFGKESGIYGAVGAHAWLSDVGRHGWVGDDGYFSAGARGGWRFKLGKKAYISPEAYLGTYYAGAGVHVEWIVIRK